MKRAAILVCILAFPAKPALAQDPVASALEGVLRGCETWVLEPASWTDGPEPFLAAMALGDRVSSVETIPDAFLPPPEFARGNRHWRVDATDRAGFALTVSDEIPMCHVAGLGFADFATAVDTVLASPAFTASWDQVDEWTLETGRSIVFRHRGEADFVMTLSQPDEARGEGIVRLLATAVYDPNRN